jgi:Xaa-Pro aminopeptidase
MIRPGVTTDKVAAVWPKAEELGFPNEDAAFGLQFGHGLGLALHERPIISRAVSLDHPMEIRTGMVFALETYCPAADGFSAARIEEEVVVTETGVRGHQRCSRPKTCRSPTATELLPEGSGGPSAPRTPAGDREP